MTTLSMYQASVPVMVRMLGNLAAILNKAASHLETKKIEPKALLDARLYPDMLPFTRQIQIASDSAKGCAARLGGVELPKFEDNETSFSELQARISKTIEFLMSVPAEKFNGSEDRDVEIPTRDGTLKFKGLDFLTGFALPNFYFHVSTAYAIMRHNGIEIGKRDFLGAS